MCGDNVHARKGGPACQKVWKHALPQERYHFTIHASDSGFPPEGVETCPATGEIPLHPSCLWFRVPTRGCGNRPCHSRDTTSPFMPLIQGSHSRVWKQALPQERYHFTIHASNSGFPPEGVETGPATGEIPLHHSCLWFRVPTLPGKPWKHKILSFTFSGKENVGNLRKKKFGKPGILTQNLEKTC